MDFSNGGDSESFDDESVGFPIDNKTAAIISVCCQLLATLVSVSPFFSLPSFSFTVYRLFCFKLRNAYHSNVNIDQDKKLVRLTTVFVLSVTAMICRQYAYKSKTVPAALSIMNFKGLLEYLTNLGKKMSNTDKEKGLIALGLANYVCSISDAVTLAWYGHYACHYTEHQLLGVLTLLTLISSFHLQLLFLAVGLDTSHKENWNGSETRVGLFQNTLGMMVGMYNRMASYNSLAKSSSNGSLLQRHDSVNSDVGLPLDGRVPSTDMPHLVRNYDLIETPLLEARDDHFIVGSERGISYGSRSQSLPKPSLGLRFGLCLYSIFAGIYRGYRCFCRLFIDLEADNVDDTASVIDPEESNLAFFIVDFFALSKSITVFITLVFLSVISIRLYLIYHDDCEDIRAGYLFSGGALGLIDLLLILKESAIFRSALFKQAQKQERAIVWECTYFVWTHGIIVCVAVACNEHAMMIPPR